MEQSLPLQTHLNLESSLWYRFRKSHRHLRIGVLSDAGGAEPWLVSAIELLALQPELEILFLFQLPVRRSSQESSPPWLFRKLNTWSRSGANDWFGLSNSFPSSAQRHTLSGCEGSELSPEDQALIRSRQLDVLLCAASSLTGDIGRLVFSARRARICRLRTALLARGI